MKDLWTEKYRPSSIDTYVFRDDKQREQVKGWVADGSLPHLLFSGAPGTGKTTLAKVLLNELEVWQQFILFIGHPIIALMASTLLAIWFLGTKRGTKKEDLVEISTKALGPAGIIILITGAGGVFKGVLTATGIADALKTVFEGSPIPIIVLAYIFALSLIHI